MKIGIIGLNIISYEQKTQYNSQEKGLGRALCALGHDVIVYHMVKEADIAETNMENEHMTICYHTAAHIGIHAFSNLQFLDAAMQCLICFSDNHLLFDKTRKWCIAHGVCCLPYIGVLKSHSTSILKKLLLDAFNPNIKMYKNMPVLAKTPAIFEEMKQAGISHAHLAPIGLDFTILKKDYYTYDKKDLKKEFGFEPEHKVIVFIGRLWEEKHPVEMIQIFSQILYEYKNMRLLFIGQGPLQDEVFTMMKKRAVEDAVCYRESIDNKEIFKAYCVGDMFINLNTNEIFGMAILEAMYYGCPVAAMHAPGPDYMIAHGVNGYLCDDYEQVKEYVLKPVSQNQRNSMIAAARERILQDFSWESTARIVERIVGEVKSMEHMDFKENKL